MVSMRVRFCPMRIQWQPACSSASLNIHSIAPRAVVTIPMDLLASQLSNDDSWRMRDAYGGCLLATISPTWRGHVLKTAARSIYSQQHPGCSMSDPVPGRRCDGTHRAFHQAEYDWMCDGRRIQCKTAQLCWSKKGLWRARFHNIKFDRLDELLLVMYTPFRIHLFVHDRRTGIYGTGCRAASRGVVVQYSSPMGMHSCDEAARNVVEKVSSASRHLVTRELASEAAVLNAYSMFCQSTTAQRALAAFQNHPFGTLTPTARGMLIEQLVLQVDRMLYPQVATARCEARLVQRPIACRVQAHEAVLLGEGVELQVFCNQVSMF
ncbi:unnamed protein product [Symbiodinium sp. CCMP2592]|nr:unnamed protein product [Symbiodinium sp. CCMP2592]